jgi:hypothetical protein
MTNQLGHAIVEKCHALYLSEQMQDLQRRLIPQQHP